jgi:hypothetical protein
MAIKYAVLLSFKKDVKFGKTFFQTVIAIADKIIPQVVSLKYKYICTTERASFNCVIASCKAANLTPGQKY